MCLVEAIGDGELWHFACPQWIVLRNITKLLGTIKKPENSVPKGYMKKVPMNKDKGDVYNGMHYNTCWKKSNL